MSLTPAALNPPERQEGGWGGIQFLSIRGGRGELPHLSSDSEHSKTVKAGMQAPRIDSTKGVCPGGGLPPASFLLPPPEGGAVSPISALPPAAPPYHPN